MFGLSFGEILIVLVVALLVLGPTGMPKLARTLGKGLRDFRRATGDIRGAFEQEFYQLDQEVQGVKKSAAAAVAADHPAAGVEAGETQEKGAPEGTAQASPNVALQAPEGTAAQASPNVALQPPEGTAATSPRGTPGDDEEDESRCGTRAAADAPRSTGEA